MAGTLLLISRKQTSQSAFSELQNKLKLKTKEVFGAYFPEIHFKTLGDNAFLIEFRKNKESKFVSDDSGNWLTFEGTVFALNETKALNAEDLLHLYLNTKKDFANELDGHFVIKLFDAKENKHVVINDFIKNKTNFLCETDNYVMFTPFAITTAGIRNPEPDFEAINEFLWRYYILSKKSVLKGVSKLLPASEYQFKTDKLTQCTYWNWPKRYTKLRFQDAVRKTTESMKESARLISNTFGTPCIDFTMGQDTRQVISAFTNQKIDITTSVFGKSDFYEVKRIKEIANQFNIHNNNIQLGKDFTDNLWSHFTNAIILGSCEQPGYLLGRLIYMRQKQSKLAHVSLNGIDGHFYKNGLWDEMYTFNLYREPKSFNVNSFLKLRALSLNYPDQVFSDTFLQIKKNSEAYFRNTIVSAIKDYLDSPVSMQVDRFDLYHWLNFTTVSNNSGNLVHHSISPLLLRRNLEFALQIPVKWKFNLSKYQRAVVYQLDPELAKLRTDFGGVNMVPKNFFTIIPHYIRYFYFQSNRLRKKIKAKMGFNVVTHLQEAWDYLPLYRKLFHDDKLQEHLRYENMLLKDIFEPNEWSTYLKKCDNPDDLKLKDFEFLFKLVSVEYFLKEAERWS